MLAIKLKRIGKKHQPAYRLIVAERRSTMVGRSLEDLGYFNPELNKTEINKDRILYWIKNGAQPTDTVHNLLLANKVIEGKKIAVHAKPKKSKEEAKAAPAATEAAK